ncbi:MAG TPA: ATP-binding cassette domain-containing protein [Firmicutes bacterium]|nr:ATP-binding cassette domain-containing protein [Bacillota bacterium]
MSPARTALHTDVDEEIIRGEGLTVRKGRRVILDVTEIRIRRGESLAIIGPNGAGKSTLIHLLAFLLRPTTGVVYFRGTAPRTHRDRLAARRKMAIVFQEPLLVDATVYQNVALGLRFRGLAREEIDTRVRHWMEVFGITGLRNERAHTLSGGEAKRASLARAFALEPDVLFLDEPFSALDVRTRQVLLNELAHVIHTTGTTTVLVTHDYTEIMPLARRTLAMVAGRIVRDGDSEGVIKEFDNQVAPFDNVDQALLRPCGW